MPTAGDDEEAARDGAWEWEEWEERLRTTEATLAVTQPLVREQLALAATYRERMAALRALAERLAGPNMHGRWVRLDDLRSEHNVRFAISTQVHMANGIRESWAAFVNSRVLALDQLFTGVDEGVDAATRAALAAYLDSGGAHVAAERAQCPDVAAAEVHAARVVEDLLRDKIQRPHIHEAKAALCNWSNVLGLVQDALLDYELTAAALTPRQAAAPVAPPRLAAHADAVRRWCKRTHRANRGSAFGLLGRDGGAQLALVTGQPADSLATADAAHTMGLIARWGAGTGGAGAGAGAGAARGAGADRPDRGAVDARVRAGAARRVRAREGGGRAAHRGLGGAPDVERRRRAPRRGRGDDRAVAASGAPRRVSGAQAHVRAVRGRGSARGAGGAAVLRRGPAPEAGRAGVWLRQRRLRHGRGALDYATHQTHFERIRSDLEAPAQRAGAARCARGHGADKPRRAIVLAKRGPFRPPRNSRACGQLRRV